MLALCLLVVSCSSPESSVDKSQKEIKVTYVDNLGSQGAARLMIEGMSCEKMCVNTVQRCVTAINSVEVEQMAFDPKVDVDTLVVSFDPQITSQDKIIEAIESQVDGDTYHVKEIQLSTDLRTSCLPQESKSDKANKTKNSQRFEVPNFLDLMRKVAI